MSVRVRALATLEVIRIVGWLAALATLLVPAVVAAMGMAFVGQADFHFLAHVYSTILPEYAWVLLLAVAVEVVTWPLRAVLQRTNTG